MITLEGYVAKITLAVTNNSLIKEVEDKNYLPQSAFNSCLNRAKAFNEPLKVRIDNLVALAIIMHREGLHDEIYTEEKNILLAAMPDEDIKTVEENYRSWWKS